MPLHTQQFGSGRDVVLLHGWGMHAGIFQPLAEALSMKFRVTLIDLPGHGRSDEADGCELDGYIEQLVAAAPEQAVWLGWSLGGMLATAVAGRHGGRVSALVLLASTPKFVADETWPQGMAPDVLAAFGESLKQDQEGTIKRFLALVARGAPDKGLLRVLRQQVLSGNLPSGTGLDCGMSFLATLDVREVLQSLTIPVMAIMGARDTLVPVGVIADMKSLNERLEINLLEQAGHAPFLSYPDECVQLLEAFMS